MPGFILHKDAAVTCVHGGQAMSTVTNPRVKVMGLDIVLQPSPYKIVACPFVPVAPSPCVAAQWQTASTRVTSNGMPIVLMDSQAICAPNATPLVILATQTRVFAI